MPTQEDFLFLRSAVASGALAPGHAEEVLAALERVEELGASSSAREIALNRGLLSSAHADQVAAAVKTPPPARAIRAIGNYQLLAKLGTGGMGVVYKAHQASMDRCVALKVLPRRLARDPSFIERFLREARSAARLNHPNIVRAYDVGEADGFYYFAMELVEGESLRQRIARLGRIGQADALEVAGQIAQALEHAHAHHLVHRDIKPDNILLTRHGVAKLADLGLAKHATDASLTQTDAPVGTPLYMSPEQARGMADHDPRSDIYSLGATLYHAVVGAPPFTGPTSASIISQHLFERPRPPRAVVPELSEGMSALLLKMLAKKPQTRHQSAAELLRDISRVRRGGLPAGARARSGSTRIPRSRRRRRRSPLLSWLAAAGVALVLLAVWLLCANHARAILPPVHGGTTLPPPVHGGIEGGQNPPHPSPPRERGGNGSAASRDEGMAELGRIREWIKTTHPDPKAAIRRLKLLAANYPGSAAVGPARDEIAAFEAQLHAAGRTAFDDALAEARRLADQEKFAQAAALLDRFGEEHRDFGKEASEGRGGVIAKAADLDRQLREQAQALAEKGDAAGALALYQRIIAFDIPQFTARAKREIELIQARQADAQRREAERARLEALDATALFHGKCRLLDGGKAELTYDFSDPAQLADWDFRGGLGELAGSQLALRGAQAVLRAPLGGEIQATIDIADAAGAPGEWSVALAADAASPPACAIVLPERPGQPLVLRAAQRDLGRCQAPFRLGEPRKLALSLRPRGVALQIDGKDALASRYPAGAAPSGDLHLYISAAGERGARVSGVTLVAALPEAWVAAELEQLRGRLSRQAELAVKPQHLLFNGVTLNPWVTEGGAWQVVDDAATTRSPGRLALRDWDHGDLELRLKIRPLEADAAVRIGFRAARSGERYELVLGSGPAERTLVLAAGPGGRTEETLARFAERVDWKADRWYDLRLVAVGTEIRAELDGVLLCLARDDRRPRGSLVLDVARGAAAFKDVTARTLD